MGIEENWGSFVNMTLAKAESHGKVAQYWDRMHNIMSMAIIFLSALTTLSVLLPITHYVGATLGAVTTLLSAINGSLNPSTRRQEQMEASRGFRALMLKMVRVELEKDYEDLWKEYNKELLGEPFLPSKFKVKDNTAFSMSPEFQIVVAQKKAEVGECLSKIGEEHSEDNCLVYQSPMSEEIDLEVEADIEE
ncbi:uncharacterized protein LOC134813430 [Bolinopsis microptera]|uniref:uncharacterized protein LOC134813430 n=1 Tax=Bolinopsis microptera TaxID=2820187 RepID=UPI003078D1D0